MVSVYKCLFVSFYTAKAPHFEFTQKLPEKFSQTKRKEVDLECFVSDPRARVKWFKNGQPIEVGLE